MHFRLTAFLVFRTVLRELVTVLQLIRTAVELSTYAIDPINPVQSRLLVSGLRRLGQL